MEVIIIATKTSHNEKDELQKETTEQDKERERPTKKHFNKFWRKKFALIENLNQHFKNGIGS